MKTFFRMFDSFSTWLKYKVLKKRNKKERKKEKRKKYFSYAHFLCLNRRRSAHWISVLSMNVCGQQR